MVDDRTQRPFGANEPARSAPKAGSSGNDPLAELARLIGQNDPFGEFGRDNARRASAPPAHEPPQAWTDVPQAAPEPAAQETQHAPQRVQQHAVPNFLTAKPAPATMPPNFGNHAFGKQSFGSAPPNDDMYQVEGGAPAFAAASTQGYDNDPYQRDNAQFSAEQDDYYEEEPKSRKRMGILVIAGVFALAVIGTAGAFGYRAIFGSSSSSVPPPVIKADTTPSKVVPAASNDPQSSKQITDRVNEKGIGERLVSREEQPVAITPHDPAPPSSTPAPQGSGVVSGAEPKKVRTIAIRPDQGMADPAAQSASASAAPPPSVPAPTSQPTPVRVIPTAKPAAAPPSQRAASNPPPAADDAEPAPAPRPAAAPRAAANAPLSLNPNAAPARAAAPAAQPARTASLPPAPASGSGGYLVQVSSQRSEAEAQSAFASLQSKFPGQLGGKQAVIRKVELGEKGTYYRAMVGAGDATEANQLCSGIKAAGGSCLVQKN
jgi:hypothetical protein